MLHVIYRSYGGENMKGRPQYYSKLLALMSFVRSFQQLETGIAQTIFLNDGPIPSDRLRVMERWGEVVAQPGLGNLRSAQNALELPASRSWPDDDLVWFAEDDYLYLPHALSDLVAAADVFPDASYFGLYALIGSRQPNGSLVEEDDLRLTKPWRDSETKLVNGRSWRSALSTAFTFGARVKPVVQDRAMMKFAMRCGGTWDHTICLMYQGLRPYPATSLMQQLRASGTKHGVLSRVGIVGARFSLDLYQAARGVAGSGPRRLVAADPALITHLESSYLAASTDWQSIATSTHDWARSEGYGVLETEV